MIYFVYLNRPEVMYSSEHNEFDRLMERGGKVIFSSMRPDGRYELLVWGPDQPEPESVPKPSLWQEAAVHLSDAYESLIADALDTKVMYASWSATVSAYYTLRALEPLKRGNDDADWSPQLGDLVEISANDIEAKFGLVAYPKQVNAYGPTQYRVWAFDPVGGRPILKMPSDILLEDLKLSDQLKIFNFE